MSDPDGLTPEQRSLVDLVHDGVLTSQAAAEALRVGDADRRDYNRAQEQASRVLTAAENAGVPQAVLDATIAAAHEAFGAPVLVAHRSAGVRG